MSERLFSTSIVTLAISLKAFPTPPITAVDAPNASTRALDAASADSNSFKLPVILPSGWLKLAPLICRFN